MPPFHSFRPWAGFLTGILAFLPGTSWASQASPLDLRQLVVSSDTPGVHLPIPRTIAFAGSQKMVFHFLGTPTFFIGIIVQSFDARGRLLHHGLFDQGPLNEVLTNALFHKGERIQILGIFHNKDKRFLQIRQISSGKMLDLPLDRALTLLTSRIGSQPDLIWAAR